MCIPDQVKIGPVTLQGMFLRESRREEVPLQSSLHIAEWTSLAYEAWKNWRRLHPFLVGEHAIFTLKDHFSEADMQFSAKCVFEKNSQTCPRNFHFWLFLVLLRSEILGLVCNS